MTTKGGNNYSFTYDESGYRTSKTKNGITTTYYYDGGRIAAEEAQGNVTVYLYDSEGLPIGMQYHLATAAEDVWQSFWYERDLQGNIISVYAHDGTKLVSYKYDAWGSTVTTYHNGGASTKAADNPFTYRGYYYDKDLGFYCLGSRYYDSKICRFINPDNNFSNSNLYMYCGNDPVNRVDRDGKHWYYLWLDDIIEGIDQLMAAVSNIVYKEAAKERSLYDPAGAQELWESRPFQETEVSPEMEVFTGFMYENDFVFDVSVYANTPIPNVYVKAGISKLLSANKNINSTYGHVGYGKSTPSVFPVSVSVSIGIIKGATKDNYSGKSRNFGYGTGYSFDYAYSESNSTRSIVFGNSYGIYRGVDFSWCLN